MQLCGVAGAQVKVRNQRHYEIYCLDSSEAMFMLRNTKGLAALNTCRLLPLDKCPGIRLIRVTEVCRRVISKTILGIVKQDVLEAVAGRQFYAGLVSGCEAALHCMSWIFDDSEGALFVDTMNTFNSLNCASTPSNIQLSVPLLHLFLLISVDLQDHYSSMAQPLSLLKKPPKGIPSKWLCM